ncbi:MAG: glycosyltransferase family 2 protein [Clostridia bacterium]|nr:glycosyltransferase family 2 protein [Clostridia bacterium]
MAMYSYQFYYLAVALIKKPKLFTAKKQHKYVIVTSARNEEDVIGHFIDSAKKQTYPQELIDIYVIADNCTDNTAKIAKEHGAIVLERHNTEKVGKGYALDYFFDKLKESGEDHGYEAFIFFDADNLLDRNYVKEINKVFDQGYEALTSYRNSKNYDSNWISAGYALWFLREAKYLNNARMMLNTSCAISGTGFLISMELIEKTGGWHYHLLTEDIQFSVANILDNVKIGYAGRAKFYDEQPHTFKQSWTQRLRWCKGFYQVVANYGSSLVKRLYKNFACFDMLMTILPAMFVSFVTIFVNITCLIMELVKHGYTPVVWEIVLGMFLSIFGFYSVLFFFGVITTITEGKEIRCSKIKKIKYCITFPVFIFTYVPIAIAALFKKVQWEPITHDVSIGIECLDLPNEENDTEEETGAQNA